MSLMNLLATGRTLDTAQDAPTRYKMAPQNFLPKFVSASRGISGAPAFAPVPAAPARPLASQQAAKKLETGSLFEFSGAKNLRADASTQNGDAKKIETMAVEGAAVTPTVPTTPAEAVVPWPKEKAKNPGRTIAPAFINPFAASSKASRRKWRLQEILFVRRKRRASGDLVQAEWSLDKVAVVRNDLSDADLEIVRATAPRVEEPERVAQTVERESGESGLVRLALKFFRMKRFGI